MKMTSNLFASALRAGEGLSRAEASDLREHAVKAELPISSILPRINPPTRKLDPYHILALAESIHALGLLEPLVVDECHRLLAGAHRYMALQLLTVSSHEQPDKWEEIMPEPAPAGILEQLSSLQLTTDLVLVRVIAFDSTRDSRLALAIEIAENEERRNYSVKEVRGMADRLKQNGFRAAMGRPKIGELSMVHTLTAVTGKSRSSIYRMLADEDAPAKSVPTDTVSPAAMSDKVCLSALEKWLSKRGQALGDHPARAAAQELVELIRELAG